ncbi:MAG: Uma2 family endonuclease [Polyangiales bacterium]
MVAASSKDQVSFAEYLAIDAKSELKHEYIRGMVYAMGGGSPEHARLAMAVGRELGTQLSGKPCAVYSSDLRVRVLETGLATYPDVTVVCGALETDPEDSHSATNPTVIVEVLSPSTEKHDRGAKYAHYRRISSLRAYVLVSQDEPLISVFTRNADESWTLRDVRAGFARIDAIACVLDVAAVYASPLGAT